MRFRVVVFALVLLAAAACGGGDSGESSGQSGGAVADVGFDDAAFCQRAERVGELFDEADTFDADESLAVLEDLADDAPSEIEGDLDLVIEAFRQFATFAEDGTEPTLDEVELEAASDRLDRYFVNVCGFEDTSEDDFDDTTDDAMSDDPATDDDSTEEFAVGGATFDDAQLTIDLSGAVNGSDSDYDPFVIECTLWDDGDFWLQVYPDAAQWTLEITASGTPGLQTGTWDPYFASVAAPFGSPESDIGLLLLSDEGTIAIDGIGAVQDLGAGTKTAEVSGRFDLQLSPAADASAQVSASGTFACLATVYEF